MAWAACRQDGGAPRYWPWVQLLGRLGHSEALAVPEQAEPEFARFLMFEAVAGALRAAAPVVLVLDDLHWADQPSLRLLDALGAHVGAAPVIVLGTYRDTEAGVAEAVAAVTAERRIVLRGLTVDDLGPALFRRHRRVDHSSGGGRAAPADRRQPVLRRRDRADATR